MISARLQKWGLPNNHPSLFFFFRNDDRATSTPHALKPKKNGHYPNLVFSRVTRKQRRHLVEKMAWETTLCRNYDATKQYNVNRRGQVIEMAISTGYQQRATLVSKLKHTWTWLQQNIMQTLNKPTNHVYGVQPKAIYVTASCATTGIEGKIKILYHIQNNVIIYPIVIYMYRRNDERIWWILGSHPLQTPSFTASSPPTAPSSCRKRPSSSSSSGVAVCVGSLTRHAPEYDIPPATQNDSTEWELWNSKKFIMEKK